METTLRPISQNIVINLINHGRELDYKVYYAKKLCLRCRDVTVFSY